MKCSRCRWPTSLWQRDLGSGLCGRCQWVDAVLPGLDRETARWQSLCIRIANRLCRGEPPESIQSKMRTYGFPEEMASDLVTGVAANHSLHIEAARLLRSGASPEEMESRLVAGGVSPSTAARVVTEVLDRKQESPAIMVRAGLMLLGGLLLAGGLGLVIGNRTGAFPTFPFAGFIVMTIGGAIFAAGQGGE